MSAWIWAFLRGITLLHVSTCYLKADDYIRPCDDELFCYGEILHKVQTSNAYEDSKTFVDMPLKYNRTYTISSMKSELPKASTKQKMKALIEKYFLPAGHKELRPAHADDWVESPRFIEERIKSVEYQRWAQHLCKVWTDLTKNMTDGVKEHEERHSLIYSKHKFVVPGGRFREFYYWDTYWSIEGLLRCDMCATVRNILLNFVDLLTEFKLIPNGGRKYYLNRSQPPFLTLMVERYWQACNDTEFVQKYFSFLTAEYNFWIRERWVQVDQSNKSSSFRLNLYASMSGYPRPESYKEDIATMQQAGLQRDPQGQQMLYSNIASAAESGWDFSSRWFSRKGKLQMTLASIRTRQIVPIDLNSILYKVERVLETFSQVTGQPLPAKFKNERQQRAHHIQNLFWDNETNLWYDFDMEERQLIKDFYASTFYPLWAGILEEEPNEDLILEPFLKKLRDLNIFEFPGGLPTSLNHSGEQWDFPNAWPPLQDIAIEGLRNIKSNSSKVKNMADAYARKIAKSFLESAYISWKKTGHMYEKYDVREHGKSGHGGEYDVQVGFGWTNGVVLKILDWYGMEFLPPDLKSKDETLHQSWFLMVVVACLQFFLI